MSMNPKVQINRIPRQHLAMIRKLASEGLKPGRIAFLTHMSESTVREVLAKAVNTTEESPAETGGAREVLPSSNNHNGG